MPSRFFEHDIRSGLKNRRKLSSYIDDLVKKKKKNIYSCKLNFIFCTDNYLLNINNTFLKHDTYTDIITFDLSDSATELSGEIYISVERVKENALKFDTDYQKELHRVLFHGVLHLCGYKDKKKEDVQKMRLAEARCLKEFFN
jgi:rRNA maturation RNase YbeY